MAKTIGRDMINRTLVMTSTITVLLHKPVAEHSALMNGSVVDGCDRTIRLDVLITNSGCGQDGGWTWSRFTAHVHGMGGSRRGDLPEARGWSMEVRKPFAEDEGIAPFSEVAYVRGHDNLTSPKLPSQAPRINSGARAVGYSTRPLLGT